MTEDLSALVAKVSQVAEHSIAIGTKLEEHIESQKESSIDRRDMQVRLENKMDALHSRLDEFLSFKVIAEQAQKDIDEHKADHKWWFGALFTAWGAIVASAAFVLNNYHKISQWILGVGKIPPSNQ